MVYTMHTLKRGDHGPEVVKLQQILAEEGFLTGACDGVFGKLTHEAVSYFQDTHVGPDGGHLADDGVVGPKTWWALENATAPVQRSQAPGKIPAGLSPQRQKLLEVALAEEGVREDPNGSNRGPRIDEFISWEGHAAGEKGPPWCCFFWSWAVKQALGTYPFGRRLARCYDAAAKAMELGQWRDKGSSYIPLPGDAFVCLPRDEGGKLVDGAGHIGLVLRVEVRDGQAVRFNTVEGNCGNAVKVGVREVAHGRLAGFINLFPPEEQPTGVETGILEGAASDQLGTR